MNDRQRLNPKSVAILRMIAQWHGYSQIVEGFAGVTCADIFAAAEEALRLSESSPDHQDRLAEIKRRHSQAYEPWSEEDDGRLAVMFKRGASIKELAAAFQRQPSATRSRLARLSVDPSTASTR